MCDRHGDYDHYTTGYGDAIDTIEDAPTADVVPKSEAEEWYREYHAIKDELKQEKEYHRSTEKLADRYCIELQAAKSEVERLEKLSDDLGRDVDVKLNYILELEEKLEKAKTEVAREIFEEIEKAEKEWNATYSPDYLGYGGDAFGYLQTDVEHTIYELKKKYTEGV